MSLVHLFAPLLFFGVVTSGVPQVVLLGVCTQESLLESIWSAKGHTRVGCMKGQHLTSVLLSMNLQQVLLQSTMHQIIF